jgi:hypothetical protein
MSYFDDPAHIVLPNGTMLDDAMNDILCKPKSQNMATLKRIKEAQKAGRSRVEAEYFVLSNGLEKPVDADRGRELHPVDEQVQASLDAATNEFQWLLRAMPVDVKFDPTKPELWGMLQHLRGNAEARKSFYAAAIKRVMEPESSSSTATGGVSALDRIAFNGGK